MPIGGLASRTGGKRTGAARESASGHWTTGGSLQQHTMADHGQSLCHTVSAGAWHCELAASGAACVGALPPGLLSSSRMVCIDPDPETLSWCPQAVWPCGLAVSGGARASASGLWSTGGKSTRFLDETAKVRWLLQISGCGQCTTSVET